MHIAFIDIAANYDAASPEKGPLGGTQAAVCYLSRELVKQSIAVSLINQRRDPSEAHGVAVLSPDVLDDKFTLAAFTHIVFNGRWSEKLVRGLRGRVNVPFLGWMHEACFQSPYILPLGDFNGLVFVSEWQKKINASLVPPATKARVIPNGIAPGFQNLKISGKVLPPITVYVGSSKRGLLHVPEILPAIHTAYPDMVFEIYSDAEVGNEAENAGLREKLRALPGLTHLGGVDQATLATRLAHASYLLSPNPYPETFCIALAEGMAAGLRVIATARAALPETAHGFAALSPFPHPDDVNWRPKDLDEKAFAAFAVQEIGAWQKRPAVERESFLSRQISYALDSFHWARHAESWRSFLGTL